MRGAAHVTCDHPVLSLCQAARTMATNEVGEFELVLGNRQLLYILLTVVTLLLLFFAMGYTAGRKVTAARPRDAPAAPTVASGEARAPTERQSASSQSVEGTTPDEPLASKLAAPVDIGAAPPQREPQLRASTSLALPPPPGSYLQVSALMKREADLLAASLEKKGFPVRLAPVPGKVIVRVLVGPLPDSGEIAKMRRDLMNIRLESIPRTY